jgi:hypothetical protein
MASVPFIIPTRATRCAPRIGPTCGTPNAFDFCLQANYQQSKKLAVGAAAWKKAYPKYSSQQAAPWVSMPFDGVRLNQNGSVVLGTLVASALTPVFTYVVPAGYEGVINQILQVFKTNTGPELLDGSGDLTWYIGTNFTFQTNYTIMTVQEGSTANFGMVAMGGGIRIKSNQILTYYVSATAGAIAGGLDPAGRVVCGFSGWIYPMG